MQLKSYEFNKYKTKKNNKYKYCYKFIIKKFPKNKNNRFNSLVEGY